jgi:hypothetical protein
VPRRRLQLVETRRRVLARGESQLIYKGENMLITRSRVLQSWFAAVVLLGVAGVALGMTLTIGTGALLLALCLVPPGMLLMLWPGLQPPTVSEVLYSRDRRP